MAITLTHSRPPAESRVTEETNSPARARRKAMTLSPIDVPASEWPPAAITTYCSPFQCRSWDWRPPGTGSRPCHSSAPRHPILLRPPVIGKIRLPWVEDGGPVDAIGGGREAAHP